MDAGSSVPSEEAGTAYSGAPVAGAILGRLFFPFISLIAALLLQGSVTDPRKKAQLRTWAWGSGGWMVFWTIIVVVVATSIGSGSGAGGVNRSGPCEGGPKMGSAATPVPGSTTKFVQPCEFGGSQTITFPSATP